MTTMQARYTTTCHRCKAKILPGQQIIREGHGMFSHPVCVPNEAECNLILESITASEAEREKKRLQRKREMAQELLTRGERRLIGTRRAIGQCVLFADQEDLFTGMALERRTA